MGWVRSARVEKGQELLFCFRSLCHRPSGHLALRVTTSLTAAGFVAGALSQAHKDIARPRRIFRIGTVALGRNNQTTEVKQYLTQIQTGEDNSETRETLKTIA